MNSFCDGFPSRVLVCAKRLTVGALHVVPNSFTDLTTRGIATPQHSLLSLLGILCGLSSVCIRWLKGASADVTHLVTDDTPEHKQKSKKTMNSFFDAFPMWCPSIDNSPPTCANPQVKESPWESEKCKEPTPQLVAFLEMQMSSLENRLHASEQQKKGYQRQVARLERKVDTLERDLQALALQEESNSSANSTGLLLSWETVVGDLKSMINNLEHHKSTAESRMVLERSRHMDVTPLPVSQSIGPDVADLDDFAKRTRKRLVEFKSHVDMVMPETTEPLVVDHTPINYGPKEVEGQRWPHRRRRLRGKRVHQPKTKVSRQNQSNSASSFGFGQSSSSSFGGGGFGGFGSHSSMFGASIFGQPNASPPPTFPTPAAQPAAALAAPPAAPPATHPAPALVTLQEEYLSLKKRFRPLEAQVRDLAKDPEARKVLLEIKKDICPKTGSLTPSLLMCARFINELCDVLAKHKQNDPLHGFHAMNVLATRFVPTQADAGDDLVFAFAAVGVHVALAFPDVLDLWLYHMHKNCPLIVLLASPEPTDLALGRSASDVDADAWNTRIGWYLKQFAAFIQTDIEPSLIPNVVKAQYRDYAPTHPFGLDKGWRWIAAFLNIPQDTVRRRRDVWTTALAFFLDKAGYGLLAKYQFQFGKVLAAIEGQYLPLVCPGGPQNPADDTDNQSLRVAVQRLDDFFVQYRKAELSPPEGRALDLTGTGQAGTAVTEGHLVSQCSSSGGFGGFGGGGGAPGAKFDKIAALEGNPPQQVYFHSVTKLEPFKTLSIEQYHWMEYESKVQGRPSLWQPYALTIKRTKHPNL